jgi:hypothetical protein
VLKLIKGDMSLGSELPTAPREANVGHRRRY